MRTYKNYPNEKYLTQEDKEEYYSQSIKVGEIKAQEILSEFGTNDPFMIAKLCNLEIRYDFDKSPNKDFVKFAEYNVKKSQFTINEAAINRIGNKLDKTNVISFIIAHELFHYFETTRWGKVSSSFKKSFKLFGLVNVNRPVLATSEFAANRFAYTLLNKVISNDDIVSAYFNVR